MFEEEEDRGGEEDEEEKKGRGEEEEEEEEEEQRQKEGKDNSIDKKQLIKKIIQEVNDLFSFATRNNFRFYCSQVLPIKERTIEL